MSEPAPVSIPMRDGATLAADLYLPAGTGPWPTILIQTPYDKNRYHELGLPLPTESYAWLILDWRGHFGSSGYPDEPSKRGEDGYDAVEWIAAEPWSDGAVGGYGESALGYAQYRTAIEHPPHFLAAVPMFIDPVRDYPQFFYGGVQKLEYMVQQAALGYLDYEATLAHSTHDGYWSLSEAIGDATYEQVAIPMLVVAGWYDLDPGDVLDAFHQLTLRSAPAVRESHRLVVGPWTHAHEDELAQGELEYPAAVGLSGAAALAFLDHHLRGVGLGLADRVRWFEMGRDTIRSGDVWPPVEVASRTVRTFQLLPANRLAEEPPPPGDPVALLVGDPTDPSPTRGGPRALPGALDGPVDLAPLVESRGDALIFTTDPLVEPLALLGAPRLVLTLDSDRLDTDVMARLTDVYPDGRSVYVTDGARRARFRAGYEPEDEELLTPGEPFELEIELEPAGLTFLAGHRLRLVLTTSNWPRFHVNPNDGGPLYSPDAQPMAVENRVHLGADAPSTFVLPVWPNAVFADGFESGTPSAWSEVSPWVRTLDHHDSIVGLSRLRSCRKAAREAAS